MELTANFDDDDDDEDFEEGSSAFRLGNETTDKDKKERRRQKENCAVYEVSSKVAAVSQAPVWCRWWPPLSSPWWQISTLSSPK